MAAKRILRLILTAFPLDLSRSGPFLPVNPQMDRGGKHIPTGLADLLEPLSEATSPSLSGLIRPEMMGVFTEK